MYALAINPGLLNTPNFSSHNFPNLQSLVRSNHSEKFPSKISSLAAFLGATPTFLKKDELDIFMQNLMPNLLAPIQNLRNEIKKAQIPFYNCPFPFWDHFSIFQTQDFLKCEAFLFFLVALPSAFQFTP